MDYTTSLLSFAGGVKTTPKPDKGVIEHATTFPQGSGAFDECQLVRLDKPDTGLQSWRMRIPSKLEVRITESPIRAIQATRSRKSMCHYVMLRGWGACVTEHAGRFVVSMAFAKDDNFVLSIAADVDYVIVTSEGAAFSFQETTFTTSSPTKDALYEAATHLTDDDLFKSYAGWNEISVSDVQKFALASFE